MLFIFHLMYYDFQVYLSKCMINNIEVSLNLKCFLDDQLFLFLFQFSSIIISRSPLTENAKG